MVMKFTNFKISRECIFPIDDIAHVRSRKTFYHISAHFQNPGFRSVSKPRKPIFIFRTGPTTLININYSSSIISLPFGKLTSWLGFMFTDRNYLSLIVQFFLCFICFVLCAEVP